MQYKTIRGQVDIELEIQRSRFLTRLQRVTSEAEAREVIAQVRAEHPRARHHCTAFIIGPDGRIARFNDDGEPSGTAGAPMHEALVAAGISDVVAVVTRYFGGILLGAGGLTRAYRAAVAEATAQATIITREEQQRISVTTNYEIHGPLVSEARRAGFTIGEAQYTEQVVQDIWVPLGQDQKLLELCAQVSAGSAICDLHEISFVDLT